jgi:hypothetical protein
MSKAERIIEGIARSSDIEIMEFDFNECFTYMREMELAIKEAAQTLEGCRYSEMPMANKLRALLAEQQ